jgi:hypothetical protein
MTNSFMVTYATRPNILVLPTMAKHQHRGNDSTLHIFLIFNATFVNQHNGSNVLDGQGAMWKQKVSFLWPQILSWKWKACCWDGFSFYGGCATCPFVKMNDLDFVLQDIMDMVKSGLPKDEISLTFHLLFQFSSKAEKIWGAKMPWIWKPRQFWCTWGSLWRMANDPNVIDHNTI